MSDIMINTGAAQAQAAYQADETGAANAAATAVTAEQAVSAMQDLAALMAKNVQVTKVTGKDGTTREIAVPELDEADEALAAQADLELLVAYLQADMDETQAAAAQKRIESNRAQYSAAHKTQLEKIDKAVAEAEKQEKAAKASRAMSWLGAIFAVVAAVAITICTGGAAAGFAIAGAVVAVTSLVLSETGLDKKIMNSIAKSLQSDGMSKKSAEAWAQGIYGGIQLVLSLSCAVGGGFASAGKSLVDVSEMTAKVVKVGLSIAGSAVSLGGMGTSAASAALNYKAGMASAEVTEVQSILQKLQKMLEENEEDLQNIIQLINDAFTTMVELLESKTDSEQKIVGALGMMNV